MNKLFGLAAAGLVLAGLAVTPASAQWFHVDDGYGGVAHGGKRLRGSRAVDSYTFHYGRGRSERLVIYEDGFAFTRTTPAKKRGRAASKPAPQVAEEPQAAPAPPPRPADKKAEASEAPQKTAEAPRTRVMPVEKPAVAAQAAPAPQAAAASPAPEGAKPVVTAGAEPPKVRVIEGVTPGPARRVPEERREFTISQ